MKEQLERLGFKAVERPEWIDDGEMAVHLSKMSLRQIAGDERPPQARSEIVHAYALKLETLIAKLATEVERLRKKSDSDDAAFAQALADVRKIRKDVRGTGRRPA